MKFWDEEKQDWIEPTAHQLLVEALKRSEIKNMHEVNKLGSKIKANYEVHIGGLGIRGCKLCEGGDGNLFAAGPSTKYEYQGTMRWEKLVEFSPDIADKITKAARIIYRDTKTMAR